MILKSSHSFHIPVMGIGFTIDTPLKVAQYGMDSVISLIDDILLEKLRKMYSEKFETPYYEISDKIEDFRAKRITSYLNLINELTEKKFQDLKNSALDKVDELKAYIHMLPDNSILKKDFKNLLRSGCNPSEIKKWANKNLTKGSIDVNIMTKVDKDNFRNDEQLSVIYNDAHAALRGYAQSNLSSSVVLSAGLNPRLFTYMSEFDDFFPNENGVFKKRIILKVSDYRSALIQGKFLAKKGLWVSEYRIESGLNCGGHAFATDGYLLGPVLAEFQEKRIELSETIESILVNELESREKVVPKKNALSFRVTAQGGIGTREEHDFLLEHYNLDSVGWGTPFLLVPEATTVDNETLNRLAAATEEDLYLSDISPLGVPFNNLRNNTKDAEKERLIEKGRPGSSCPKKFVALNKEFTEKGICTASRQYQHLKLKELDRLDVSKVEYDLKYNSITEKSCTCVGLGTSALLAYDLDTKIEGKGVSICPGPNMAYYSKKMSLKEITDHIYGRGNVITRTDRPNFFVKELTIYLEFLRNKLDAAKVSMNRKEEKYLETFINNMKEGVAYYQELFGSLKLTFENPKSNFLQELRKSSDALESMSLEIDSLKNLK